MFTRLLPAAAVGALLIGLAVQPTNANAWASANHREHLTFSAPIALPGVVLAAGTYTFEIPSEGASHSIVRVTSRDGRQIYLTRFTRLVPKPNTAAAVPHVTFGEAAAGMPRPVNTWYPQNEEQGRQFIY